MIDSILDELARTDFDFRNYANPGDPLKNLFPDWVRYYRLKYAIAKVLQPKSILEIGVRVGYSARAFLEASPAARLVGIDLNGETFGGTKSALAWAREMTAGYEVEFIEADSQRMATFPGGVYDLIHVDGQQDGLGTFHDLRKAAGQARWILLDGYFWTRENFLNANDFVLKYKDVLKYVVTIPGYAGELLLRVSDAYLDSFASRSSEPASESTGLTHFYDSNYYLNDCGGYREFRRHGAERVEDRRLLSILMLARLGGKGPALDLGCGRGEIAYQLAVNGVDVTAVDYSAAAIELAQSCFAAAPRDVRARATFICGDVGALQLEQKFAIALAGDLIEHLSATELRRFYRSVAQHLADPGVFVIHTAPNVWRYRRDHERRRKAVERLGGFLPREPRTRYELLMHINEQSPARLRRALQEWFPHVTVWVGSPDNPFGSLSGDWTLRRWASAPDIYAVASREPLDRERLNALLSTAELEPGEHSKISLHAGEWPTEVQSGATFTVPVKIRNESSRMISSLPPFPIHLSYHWSTPAKDRVLVFNGVRTSLPFGVDACDERLVTATIEAPGEEGSFLLSISLVQERCCWFEKRPGFAPAQAVVTVRGNPV